MKQQNVPHHVGEEKLSQALDIAENEYLLMRENRLTCKICNKLFYNYGERVNICKRCYATIRGKTQTGDGSGDNGRDFEDYSYPYIFKPPSPPGDLALSGQAQLKVQIPKVTLWKKLYCKYCGSPLSEGQSICHVCKNKVE